MLTLPVELEADRVGSALRALRPGAIVLAGSGSSADALGRLVYASRQAEPGVDVFDYRSALPETGASTVKRIGPGPTAAAEQLRERLTGVVLMHTTAATAVSAS